MMAALAVATLLLSAEPCGDTVALGEKVIASTVTVLADGDQGIVGSGSGFFVEEDLVVTNWHVVGASKKLRVKLGQDAAGTVSVVGIVAADLANDLAVIRVASSGVPLTVNAEVPKRGAKVYAFGSPRLLEATMSDGIISAVRDIEGVERYQMTAAVSPGSSGGPLTNACGEVIGVAYMKVRDAESLNFAIPSRFVVDVLKNVGPPQDAEVIQRSQMASLRKITASRLGVPQGVDPEQWVQIDPVTQKFFVGISKRELDGASFLRHVGRGDLVTDADNTFATVLYGTAGACAAASLCTCAVSAPFVFVGFGVLTGAVGGAGLCASAGLAGLGALTWSDGAVPDLSFEKREAMALKHNAKLEKKGAKNTGKKGQGGSAPPDGQSPLPPPLGDPPVGDDPAGDAPPPLDTPTPSLDRPAQQPTSMRY
jgi:hypothetical protein